MPSDMKDQIGKVLAAANASASLVDTKRFALLTQTTLDMVCPELAGDLGEKDTPTIYAPIELEREGTNPHGAILALEGRLIIAWMTGTFRVKKHEVSLTKDMIESLDHTTKPGGRITKDQDKLVITANGEVWNLLFPCVFEGGRNIVPFILQAFNGGIQLVREAS